MPAPVSLEHTRPHCTGRWAQQLISRRLYWLCQDCQAIGYHSDAVAEAAIRENQLGVTLRHLANAGDCLIADAEEDLGW